MYYLIHKKHYERNIFTNINMCIINEAMDRMIYKYQDQSPKKNSLDLAGLEP